MGGCAMRTCVPLKAEKSRRSLNEEVNRLFNDNQVLRSQLEQVCLVEMRLCSQGGGGTLSLRNPWTLSLRNPWYE